MKTMKSGDVDRMRELFHLEKNGDLVWKETKGSRAIAGSVAGSMSRSGYLKVLVDGKQYMAHRIVFAIHNGRWPSDCIDHIDSNKTNNRPENLRELSNALNIRRAGKKRRNKSGLSGVFWHKKAGKWIITTRLNGSVNYLGLRDSIFEAAAVRLSFENSVQHNA